MIEQKCLLEITPYGLVKVQEPFKEMYCQSLQDQRMRKQAASTRSVRKLAPCNQQQRSEERLVLALPSPCCLFGLIFDSEESRTRPFWGPTSFASLSVRIGFLLASTRSYNWIEFSKRGSLGLQPQSCLLLPWSNIHSETSVNLGFTTWQHYQKIVLIAVTDVRRSVHNYDP
jgi:hypothetical protein